jgi:hypothetical protein
MLRAEAIAEEIRRYLAACDAHAMHLAHLRWLTLARLRGRAPWDTED